MSEPPLRYRGQTWVDPRQGFRASPTQGIGSFALAPIREGEAVEVVGGVLMEELRAFVRSTPRFNAIQIDDGLHLVEPPEVTLGVRRDIAADEELTVDYALHTADPDLELDGPRNCGSALCRGTVRGSDWRLPEVQERCLGHFSPFINERIAKTER